MGLPVLLSIGGSLLSAGGFNSAFGWALASIAASSIFGAPEAAQGPRLSSLSVQTADPGQAIPCIYGSMRLSGNIIWSKKIREHKKTRGGKGSPAVTSYSYSWSGAVLVSEESEEILEIWGNNIKIYSANDGNPKPFALTHHAAYNGYSYYTNKNKNGFRDGGGLRIYTGHADTPPDPLIEADKGVGKVPAWLGRTVVVFQSLGLMKWGQQLPSFTFLVRRNIGAMNLICQDICKRVGVADGEMDFSKLSDLTTDGFALHERTEARNYLEMVERAYGVRFVEYDHKLRVVKLYEQEPVATLTESDLGFVDSSSTEADNGQSVLKQPRELPYEVDCWYIDKTRDYTRNMQPYNRQITDSLQVEDFSLPMVFNAAQARRIAQNRLTSMWTERMDFSRNLGYKYLYLVPGDVITVPSRGGPENIRVEEINKLFFGPQQTRGVRHQSSSYAQPLLGNDDGYEPTLPLTYDAPRVVLADCHALNEQDTATAGIYIAACAPPESGWNGAGVFQARILNGDPGTPRAIELPYQVPIGECVNTLPDFAGKEYFFDTTSELLVDMVVNGETGRLFSATMDDLRAGNTNAALVGRAGHWEILQFATVLDVGDQGNGLWRFKLSNLLRGRRGTSMYIAGHAASEDFVLLTEDVQRIQLSANSLGLALDYTVTYGEEEDFEVTATAQGYSLKPLPCFGLKTTRVVGDDIEHSWFAQTRADSNFWESGRSPTDPATHDTDSYYLEVRSADGVTLKRSGIVTDRSYTYSQAHQTADFGGLATSYIFDIYRLSDITTPASPDKRGYRYRSNVAIV